MSSCLQASLTPIDLNHPILTTFCHQAANILDTQIKMFRQVTVLQQNVFLAVQDSSITDIVCPLVGRSLGRSQLTIRA